MGAKIWVPLVMSVVLGLGAALLAGKMLRPTAARASGDVSVAVAARDIDAGTELTADDLTTIKYPPKEVPPGAIIDPRQLTGRVSLAPMIKGQLATETMLAPSGVPAGLRSLVPAGMRAVTLEVSEFSGLAGMLTPGEHVDVIANIRDDKTHDTAARTIVQDIRVLAVGRSLGQATASSGSPAPIPNNCTLLVTPKQAQTIQLASQSSRPWLVLRGFKDGKKVDPGTTSLAELRGESDQPVAKPQVVAEPSFPTTQPVQAIQTYAPPSADEPPHRVVTLILGADEQRLSFRVEPESDGTVTNTDSKLAVP